MNAMFDDDLLKRYPILAFFKFEHLKDDRMRERSRQFALLALECASEDTKHPAEVGAGLRKLLEAKDCLVRALLP